MHWLQPSMSELFMLRNTYGGFNMKAKELGDGAQGIANGLKYFCHPYGDYKPAQLITTERCCYLLTARSGA